MVHLSEEPIKRVSRTRLLGKGSALIALGIILFIPVSFLYVLNAKLNIEPLHLGQPLPKLELVTSSGISFPVDNCDGKKIVLLFFTIECPHCQKALINLEWLMQKYGDKLAIVSISLSDANKTVTFVAERKFTFPVLLTDKNKARKSFKIAAVPALFLFDERRKLKFIRFGEWPIESGEQLINDFLTNTLNGDNK